MTLLKEIEDGAVDGSSDLAELLRKCYVLGARLGVDELEEWVQHELDGYPEGVAVPDYRRVRLVVKGNFVSATHQATGQPVTAAELPNDTWRKNFRTYDARESIAVVASLVSDGEIAIEAGDLASVLEWRGMHCTRAWAAIHSAEFRAILNAVRSRLLRLATSLRKKHPEAGEKQEPAEAANGEIAQTVVNVLGHGAVNVGGSNNVAVAGGSVAVGDLDALKKTLASSGVPAEDVAELEEAINADGKPREKGGFGARVKDWLKSAGSKIVDGVWKGTVAAGTSLLTAALKSYYGFDE